MTPEAGPDRGPAALASKRTLTCASCGTVLHGDPTCPSCGDPVRTPAPSETIPALVEEMRARLERAVEGRYELRGLLGHGGMGAVFLAVELRLDRLVAIKVLPPTLAMDAELLSRFEREARTAARLDHPGIVPIYSVEDRDGLHFFVMKFVPGIDLDEALQDGPLPADTARRILVDAARALAHAHERGVIHRDVKPSNIMIDPEGRVVVADFGIAKAASSNAGVTATGQALGSPWYMSPEQTEARDVDGRSDQYGLGMVAWHMLAGRPPFEGTTYGSVLVRQITEYPDALSSLRDDLPDDLVASIERAIRKDPDERFPDLNAFADAVEGRAMASGAPLRRKPAPPSRRLGVLTAVGALVVAAGASFWALRGSDEAPSPGASGLDVQGTGARASTAGPDPVFSQPSPEEEEEATTGGEAGRVPDGTAEGDVSPAPAETRPQDTTAPETASPAVGSAPPPEEPATMGSLTLNATPYAYVCIDGIDLGRSTPIFDLGVEPGPRVVVLYRAGYRQVVDTIDVAPRNPTRRQFTMFEDPAGRTGC